MGIHLSGVVGAIATLPAALAVLGRDSLPPPVELVLCHTALSGFLVAAAATEALAAHSMGMLGKVRCGSSVSIPASTAYRLPPPLVRAPPAPCLRVCSGWTAASVRSISVCSGPTTSPYEPSSRCSVA